jgi:DNA-binding IclR family transcriptional regulator
MRADGGGRSRPESPASQVQSVDRALAVLDILARRGDAGVTEIAAELGVHKSTAFRLVVALESRRLVEQVGDRGKYRLGLGILRLAAATTGRLEVTHESRPVCVALARDLGETVNVALLESDAAINILQEYGTAAVSSRDWIGRRTPLHATSSGKVLLAHAGDAVRERVLAGELERYTESTIIDPAELERQLERAIRLGWACTAEELEVGLNAVAAPIRDGRGDVVAAVSVSGPSYRFTADGFPDVADRLLRGATEISERLGYYR